MTAKVPARIASFGFRSLPPRAGGAGADKFALELLPRLAALGHEVTGYNRIYPGDDQGEVEHTYAGVRLIPFKTISKSGFDVLLHSAKATWDIIVNNRADVVHMQSGANSPFGLVLRLFGKKTVDSYFAFDWQRPKWPWYAKLYLWLMSYLTAFVHNEVVFDNIFSKQYFEKKFKRRYAFIPFGSDVNYDVAHESILTDLNVKPGEYFLFVGRFIPDKGVHYLVEAFSRLKTDKKLVLIGGSPNPSPYEAQVKATDDPRILFPGFVYGGGTHALMRNAYAYVQPSDIEGLSPVILESAFLGAPIVCADIEQNEYIMREDALYFRKSDVDHLEQQLAWALAHPGELKALAAKGQSRVKATFSWDVVVKDFSDIFNGVLEPDYKRRSQSAPTAATAEKAAA